MKCISDGLIQKYIDEEASGTEVIYIKEHLKECDSCRQRLTIQNEISHKIKELLNHLPTEPFETKQQNTLKKNSKTGRIHILRIVAGIAAACVIAMVFLIENNKQQKADSADILNTLYINSDYDANKPVTEQSLEFSITDPNGNVTTYQIE